MCLLFCGVVLFFKVSKGNRVSIGIIVIFWNSSIENVLLLVWDFIRLCFVSDCNIMVVEESVRYKFMVKLVVMLRLVKVIRVNCIVRVVSFICRLFRFRIEWCSCYSCFGCNFRLIRNSIIIILNFVKCMILVWFFISCKRCGLMSVLVSR